MFGTFKAAGFMENAPRVHRCCGTRQATLHAVAGAGANKNGGARLSCCTGRNPLYIGARVKLTLAWRFDVRTQKIPPQQLLSN